MSECKTIYNWLNVTMQLDMITMDSQFADISMNGLTSEYFQKFLDRISLFEDALVVKAQVYIILLKRRHSQETGIYYHQWPDLILRVRDENYKCWK